MTRAQRRRPGSWPGPSRYSLSPCKSCVAGSRPRTSQSGLGRSYTSMCITTGGMVEAEDNPMDRLPQLLTNAPLCQARNRAGNPCRCPAIRGKKRCKRHGGAKGSGAPPAERNGMWRHGSYTNEAIALRRAASQLVRKLQETRLDA